jgi:hypothetical protein
VLVEPVPALMERLMERHDHAHAHGRTDAAGDGAGAGATPPSPFAYEARFVQAAVCNESQTAAPFFVAAAAAAAANPRAWFLDQLGSLDAAHLGRHGVPGIMTDQLAVECLSYRALLARLAGDRTLRVPRRAPRGRQHPDVLLVDAEGSDLDIDAQVLDGGDALGALPLLIVYEASHGGGSGGGGGEALAARLADAGYVCERVSSTDAACVRGAAAAAAAAS